MDLVDFGLMKGSISNNRPLLLILPIFFSGYSWGYYPYFDICELPPPPHTLNCKNGYGRFGG
jgi:hypothetical protein